MAWPWPGHTFDRMAVPPVNGSRTRLLPLEFLRPT